MAIGGLGWARVRLGHWLLRFRMRLRMRLRVRLGTGFRLRLRMRFRLRFHMRLRMRLSVRLRVWLSVRRWTRHTDRICLDGHRRLRWHQRRCCRQLRQHTLLRRRAMWWYCRRRCLLPGRWRRSRPVYWRRRPSRPRRRPPSDGRRRRWFWEGGCWLGRRRVAQRRRVQRSGRRTMYDVLEWWGPRGLPGWKMWGRVSRGRGGWVLTRCGRTRTRMRDLCRRNHRLSSCAESPREATLHVLSRIHRPQQENG